MNILIKHTKKLLSLVLLLALLTHCKDYNDLETTPVDSGDADFSSYVAIGNSLTAGYQNGALYEDAQAYSFPNLLARQLQLENFEQPLISNPGIGGRIELTNLDPITTTTNGNQGAPITQSNKPFSNLGIPGAVLVDYVNPNNSGNLKERATNQQNPAFNPFYSIVLEDAELAKDAPSIHHQVAKQDPTFITFWLGNNDVLNFVTSGGQGSPTPPSTFSQLYQASAQSLASTGADVMVYNIPDVTNIPFVFYLRSQMEQQKAIRYNADTQSYQLAVETQQGTQYLDIYVQTDDGARIMRQNDFPILPAKAYFAKIQAGEVTPPIDANGDGTPESAIPDKLVLDGPAGGPAGSSELEQAIGTVAQYNTTIQTVASASNFTVVDINAIFSDIFNTFKTSNGKDGYNANGLNLRPVPGELFSFDGIHPSNRGAAVIANKSIESINNTYNSNIESIDVTKIPRGLPVASN